MRLLYSTYARHITIIDNVICYVAEADFLYVPAREQTSTESLHQLSCIDPLTLKALVRAPASERECRSTETELGHCED